MKDKMNIIDSAIAFFNPAAGLKRVQARKAIEAVRAYEGASRSNRTKNWNPRSASVNVENQIGMTTLRDRTRDLVRNNAYSNKAVEFISNAVVGAGIRPRIDDDSVGKTDKKRLLKLWKQFAETTACDFDGNLNFYGLQHLMIRSKTESGEVLVRRRRVNFKDNILPIQFQLVEGDLLDHLKNENFRDGGYIAQGIEFDANGKKSAYWVYDRHPNETLGFFTKMPQSQRVPIEDLIHVYELLRPGQLRGIPDGTSGMMAVRDFDDYEDAQLVRQKVAACFAVFVHDNTENLASNINEDTEEEDDGTLGERVQPGLIEHLPPGKTVSFASPPTTEGYGEYAKNVLRKIASAWGITYESLTGDLSNVNFTSFKAGQIGQNLRVENIQNNVATQPSNKMWKWFVDAAIMAGKVSAGAEGATVSWTPPRKDMVDPVKEIKGLSEEVRNGFTSWSEAVMSRGWNPEELLFELAKDSNLFEEYKLMLACDPRFDVNRQSPNHASLMLTGSAVAPAPTQTAPAKEKKKAN